MTTNRIPSMPISEFFGRLRPFMLAASSKERIADYLNHGDDSNYQTRVFYELCAHLMVQNEHLQAEIDKLNQVLGVTGALRRSARPPPHSR